MIYIYVSTIISTPCRWHPYIPPFGFSRCAVCTCKVSVSSAV